MTEEVPIKYHLRVGLLVKFYEELMASLQLMAKLEEELCAGRARDAMQGRDPGRVWTAKRKNNFLFHRGAPCPPDP